MGQRIIGLLVSIGLTLGVVSAACAQDTVRIGWTAWSDAEFVTRLAQRILEERMGQQVELVQTDIAPQYLGTGSGDIDVMLMSWLPRTHSGYMDTVGDRTVDLGLLYDHARLGWVVPDYVPEDQVDSIEDLRKESVREKLDGTITGIDAGAGLSRLSMKALSAYGLDGYELRISSEAGMTAALERAIANEQWIVVTGWSPHWKFDRWDLRYIEDPMGALGSWERVHAIARDGFYQDNIDAATMLSRMWIPIDDLRTPMLDARRSGYEEAVTRYIDNNGDRIEYWISGDIY